LQFLEGAISTVALVGLALAGAGAYAIAAFRGVGAAAVLPFYRLSTGKIPLVSPTAREIFGVTKRGALMSGYVAFAGLSSVAPGTLIAMTGDLESAGVIVWSLQFAMQLPTVIGFAARQVHMSVASNMRESGTVQIWHSDIRTLILASFAACLFQALIAPVVIPIVFPNAWQAATIPVQTLSIAQVLLPLLTVSVGNALVRGRLWHVILAASGGLAVICGGAAVAVIGPFRSMNEIATCISAGYLLANFTSYMILAALEDTALTMPSAWALATTLGGFALLVLLEVKLHGTPGTALRVGLWTTLATFCAVALAEWRKILLHERS
jgi:O-antigen/teichoic acid export membrane protein